MLYTSIIFFLIHLCWFCPFSTYPFVIAFVTSMCHSALNGLWHSWQINGIPSGSSFFRKPDIKYNYSRWIHWLASENKWRTTQVNAVILVQAYSLFFGNRVDSHKRTMLVEVRKKCFKKQTCFHGHILTISVPTLFVVVVVVVYNGRIICGKLCLSHKESRHLNEEL